MAVNGIGPSAPNVQLAQPTDRAAERRLAEQRQLAQNPQATRGGPGTPAPGSIISVTA